MENVKEIYEELKSLIAKDPLLFEKRAKEIVDNHIALAPKERTATLIFLQANLERAKQSQEEIEWQEIVFLYELRGPRDDIESISALINSYPEESRDKLWQYQTKLYSALNEFDFYSWMHLFETNPEKAMKKRERQIAEHIFYVLGDDAKMKKFQW